MGCKGSWLNLVTTALGKAQWSLLGWPIGQMGNDPLYVSINHVGVQGSLWYIGVRQRAGTGAGWGTQFASISSLKGWDCCWTSKIRGCYRKLLNSSYFPHQSLWFTLGFGVVFLFDEENVVGSGCFLWLQCSDTASCWRLRFGCCVNFC